MKSDNQTGYINMISLKIYSILFLLFFSGFQKEGLQAAGVSEPEKGALNNKPMVYEEFELIEGLEVGDINFWEELITGSYSRRRVIQLKEGSTKGRAEIAFFEPSAKYNITVTYVEAKKPGAELFILVNGNKAGVVKYGDSHSFREITFENVNVQKWSKILLEFSGTNEDRCRVEKIVFSPAGVFEGQQERLEKPVTLKVFESYDEVQRGRRIFHDYVRHKSEEVDRQRNLEIDGIKNFRDDEAIGASWQDSGIEKWKARQDEIRKRLSSYRQWSKNLDWNKSTI